MNVFVSLMTLLYLSCSASNEIQTPAIMENQEETTPVDIEGLARVTDVSVSGETNNYNFSVTIASPDTGCDQYADWWEVFTEDGTLIYRRILAHSHVNEQPFTRGGGGVAIGPDDVVYIRAHMNNTGYGTEVFKGSVSGGFVADELAQDFATDLATQDPLPSGCAF